MIDIKELREAIQTFGSQAINEGGGEVWRHGGRSVQVQ